MSAKVTVALRVCSPAKRGSCYHIPPQAFGDCSVLSFSYSNMYVVVFHWLILHFPDEIMWHIFLLICHFVYLLGKVFVQICGTFLN